MFVVDIFHKNTYLCFYEKLWLISEVINFLKVAGIKLESNRIAKSTGSQIDLNEIIKKSCKYSIIKSHTSIGKVISCFAPVKAKF